MLCERCHKQEANVIQEIMINNQRRVAHLCEDCAAKEDPITSMIIGMFKGHSKPKNILSGEAGLDDRCPNCGTSLREIQMRGKFGCGICYKIFKKKLYPLIAACQKGATKHVGKRPNQRRVIEFTTVKLSDLQKEMAKLEEEMNEAVRTDKFEIAAEKRDKIKELEKKLEEERAKTTG